ncbi:carbonic anhydrase 1-like [Panonychus citri]|uniref:carbonic anhydrase 1-like n=1 Tax=Panonychus citri TaxID=50023 RepID=UPI002307AB41|nr:carbonic anhydrase 1-like [Panonychus citri]
MWTSNLKLIFLFTIISLSASWLHQIIGVMGQFPDEQPYILTNPLYPLYELKRYSNGGDDVDYIGTGYDRIEETVDEEDNKLDPDHIDYEDKERKPAMDIANWTYQEQEEWERLYPDCGGNNQSPINIDEQLTEKDDVTEIFFDPSYEVCCRSMEIKNTGRSVELAISEGKGPIVTGPFVDNEAYHFTQLHFHWGTEPEQGSEHAINNERYDMEMHFVHYNKKYGDFNEASTKPDGLVVIATLFKISESNNPALEDIVRKLEKIRCGGLRYELGARLNLLQLLPSSIDKYYQYQGSLTTPPCSESVTWIVFKNSQNIGRKQITKFRNLFQDKKCTIEMGSVTRQLQPINERIVYSSTSTNNQYPTKLHPNGLSRIQMIGRVIGLRDLF